MLEATTGYIIAFLPRKRDIVVDGAIVARAERAMAGFSYSMRSQVVKLELGEAGLGLSISSVAGSLSLFRETPSFR